MKKVEKPGWKYELLDDAAEVCYGTRVVRKIDGGAKYLVYGGGGATFRVDRFNRENCMIVSRFGMSEECVRWVGGKFFLNDSGLSLRTRNADLLSQQFLDIQMFGRQHEIYSLGRGTAQKNLDLTAFRSLPIVIPPLEEQQRIVAVLNEAFEGLARARANAEANLQSARELFGSALHRTFSDENEIWEEKELMELGDIQTGSTPKTSDVGNKGNYVPFIKPGDFKTDGTLDYHNEGLSEQGAKVSRLISADSALMVCIGATIGKAGFSDRQIATNQQINSISPRRGISGEYLYYQMLKPTFQAAVIHASGQATLPIINKSKWSKLSVQVPARPERQVEIVEMLNKVRARTDDLSDLYRQSLEDLDDLRQSLLRRAFAGELT